MRVLQIIDSLNPGGAERMVVNIANELATQIEFSGIVATRKSGELENQIKPEVQKCILYKKNTFDFKALKKLIKIIKTSKINVIHAHGTSIFIAFLVKLYFRNQVKVIWHDHLGSRISSRFFKNLPLIIFSCFFDKVLVVNNDMVNWFSKYYIKAEFFPNFAQFYNSEKKTKLAGHDGKRIVCLANLKSPKNHYFLVNVFSKLTEEFPNWTLHLVGKIFNDDYYNQIFDFVKKNKLESSVFFYNAQNDIENILNQSNLGVLASTSEGFPVTLLEYGLANLPVICSNVGYNSEIVQDGVNGFIFENNNLIDFQKKLHNFLSLPDSTKTEMGIAHNRFISNNFDLIEIIKKLTKLYNN